jgi:hypothetical protein
MKPMVVSAVVLGVLSPLGCNPQESPTARQGAQEVASRLQVFFDSLREAHDGVGIPAAVVFVDGSVGTGVSGVSYDSVP